MSLSKIGPLLLAAGMAIPATALVTTSAHAAKAAKTAHKSSKKSHPKAKKTTHGAKAKK
ncbi:MAG: hypothetical protein KC776_02245 [Myxococcales bacterium]|nr:hypothetical protein [Myxococcales bacterium]MCB9582407.1 hypothetical protein [Polyangiaceae bacterium]